MTTTLVININLLIYHNLTGIFSYRAVEMYEFISRFQEIVT